MTFHLGNNEGNAEIRIEANHPERKKGLSLSIRYEIVLCVRELFWFGI